MFGQSFFLNIQAPRRAVMLSNGSLTSLSSYTLSYLFSQEIFSSTMAEPALQEIHDFLIELAKKAGSMIISANPSTVDTKKNCTAIPSLVERLADDLVASDLVTETDKAVEDLISSSLKSAYPDYSCISPNFHFCPNSQTNTPKDSSVKKAPHRAASLLIPRS